MTIYSVVCDNVGKLKSVCRPHLAHRPGFVECWWRDTKQILKQLTLMRMLTMYGSSPALRTAWIWLGLPAVTLDIAHAASFWMLFFVCCSSPMNADSALLSIIT